jgi:hypothetical protein
MFLYRMDLLAKVVAPVESLRKTLPAILQVARFRQIGKSKAELEC